jgi:hypothetical protein
VARDGSGNFTANVITANGSALTSLNASNISSGTVATARLGSGTANNTTFLRGDSTYAGVTQAPNPLHGSQDFTSSGTFNVPTGVTNVKVTVIGAGGNGGTADSGCGGGSGGGGGAGGYVVAYVAVTSGGTVSVTVGTNAGSRTSSFAGGSTITAAGGTNGSDGSGGTAGNSGLSGASTVFGLTSYTAGGARLTDSYFQDGLVDLITSGTNIESSGQVYGHGFGVAGEPRTTAAGSTNRHTPLGYGAGAGGGISTATAGGTGVNGLVIVEW